METNASFTIYARDRSLHVSGSLNRDLVNELYALSKTKPQCNRVFLTGLGGNLDCIEDCVSAILGCCSEQFVVIITEEVLSAGAIIALRLAVFAMDVFAANICSMQLHALTSHYTSWKDFNGTKESAPYKFWAPLNDSGPIIPLTDSNISVSQSNDMHYARMINTIVNAQNNSEALRGNAVSSTSAGYRRSQISALYRLTAALDGAYIPFAMADWNITDKWNINISLRTFTHAKKPLASADASEIDYIFSYTYRSTEVSSATLDGLLAKIESTVGVPEARRVFTGLVTLITDPYLMTQAMQHIGVTDGDGNVITLDWLASPDVIGNMCNAINRLTTLNYDKLPLQLQEVILVAAAALRERSWMAMPVARQLAIKGDVAEITAIATLLPPTKGHIVMTDGMSCIAIPAYFDSESSVMKERIITALQDTVIGLAKSLFDYQRFRFVKFAKTAPLLKFDVNVKYRINSHEEQNVRVPQLGRFAAMPTLENDFVDTLLNRGKSMGVSDDVDQVALTVKIARRALTAALYQFFRVHDDAVITDFGAFTKKEYIEAVTLSQICAVGIDGQIVLNESAASLRPWPSVKTAASYLATHSPDRRNGANAYVDDGGVRVVAAEGTKLSTVQSVIILFYTMIDSLSGTEFTRRYADKIIRNGALKQVTSQNDSKGGQC
jgi:hypothetical protein